MRKFDDLRIVDRVSVSCPCSFLTHLLAEWQTSKIFNDAEECTIRLFFDRSRLAIISNV